MGWPNEAADCAKVILLDGSTFASHGKNCYQLFLKVSQAIITHLQQLNPGLTWDSGSLRVGLYAFWCKDDQKTAQW